MIFAEFELFLGFFYLIFHQTVNLALPVLFTRWKMLNMHKSRMLLKKIFGLEI